MMISTLEKGIICSEIWGDWMDNSELTNALMELGLTQYESKIYITLVTEGVSTAKDISNICGIPYGKIYEIINSLTNKGFVLVLPTKPMKYRAISPRETIKLVKDNMSRKIVNAENTVVRELESAFKKNKAFIEPKGLFWVINGRTAINKKMEELFEKAEDHIYMFLSEKGFNRLRYYHEVLRELRKKGVKITISTTLSECNSEALDYLKFCNVGHVNHNTANQFISVDGKEALMYEALPDDENLRYGRDLGVWVLNKSFTSFIESFFEINHNQTAPSKDMSTSLKMKNGKNNL
jgi:sugar-specific transcriptional regulator TrmB